MSRILLTKAVVLGLGIVFLWTAAPSWAAESVKIGVVDFNKCLQQSDAGRKIFSSLNEKKDRIKKELDAKQEELKKLSDEYNKKATVLSAEAKREKEKELIRKDEDLREVKWKRENELNKEADTHLQPLVNDLHGFMQKLAKDEGYTLILESKTGAVYYFTSPVTDITDKVIRLANEPKKEKKK